MPIVRSRIALLGTDESAGTAIASAATATGTEQDLLGDDASVGEMWLYALIISTVAVGTIDIKFNTRRVTGQAYSKVNFDRSIAPINGTQRIPLGKVPIDRYGNVEVKNNATGASATVSILGTVEKLS
jgi:hypothetical protein